MGYKVDKFRFSKFYGYICKRYNFLQLVSEQGDGTEYFRSESIHCDECLEYHIQTKDGIITHYVHRVVIAQKVGCSLKPIMAAEKILPKDKTDDNTTGHEGELTAAKRLAF
jgi:hypothetical protein